MAPTRTPSSYMQSTYKADLTAHRVDVERERFGLEERDLALRCNIEEEERARATHGHGQVGDQVPAARAGECSKADSREPSFVAQLAKTRRGLSVNVEAAHWLSYLSVPPAHLAPCLTIARRNALCFIQHADQLGDHQPCVHVHLPTYPGSSATATFDLGEVLSDILQLLVENADYTMAVQTFLLAVVSLEPPHSPSARYVVPTLRTRSDVLDLVISACFHWIAVNSEPLTAIAILSGFVSPCNAADLPAARATCAIVRARTGFPALMFASLREVHDPRSSLILGRFWDAFLGTPPQSEADARALQSTLGALATSSNLHGSLAMLLGGIQARATEESAVCRYAACTPLLRIIAALLTSSTLLSALVDGLEPVFELLLTMVMDVAARSMGGGGSGSSGGSGGGGGGSGGGSGEGHVVACTSMHDLLAAVCLETIATAVTQPLVLERILIPPMPDPGIDTANAAGNRAEAGAVPMSRLGRALLGVVAAAISRLATVVPPLPRLPDALRRLYGALQRDGGDRLRNALRANALDAPATHRAIEHIAHLVKVPPTPPATIEKCGDDDLCDPEEFPTMRTRLHVLSNENSEALMEPSNTRASSSETIKLAHTTAEDAVTPAPANLPWAVCSSPPIGSYPLLPPNQPFECIDQIVAHGGAYGIGRCNGNGLTSTRAAIGMLPEAPRELLVVLSGLAAGAHHNHMVDGDDSHGSEVARPVLEAHHGDSYGRAISRQLRMGEKAHGAAVRLGLGKGRRHLVALEPIAPRQLVAEYCGELVDDADGVIADLAKYMTTWPSQLYLLRVGASRLALDISRASSVARFAEHSAERPTCSLHAYRTHSSSAGWVPRVCVRALQGLKPGEAITLDYTAFAVGGLESHIHADWVMRMRATPPRVPAALATPAAPAEALNSNEQAPQRAPLVEGDSAGSRMMPKEVVPRKLMGTALAEADAFSAANYTAASSANGVAPESMCTPSSDGVAGSPASDHKCGTCGRAFGTLHGLAIHRGRSTVCMPQTRSAPQSNKTHIPLLRHPGCSIASEPSAAVKGFGGNQKRAPTDDVHAASLAFDALTPEARHKYVIHALKRLRRDPVDFSESPQPPSIFVGRGNFEPEGDTEIAVRTDGTSPLAPRQSHKGAQLRTDADAQLFLPHPCDIAAQSASCSSNRSTP